MRARHPIAALAFAAALALAARPARADEADVQGTVSFVSARSIYLSLGSEDGVVVGGEVVVLRAGRRLGRLRIEAVSTRSAVGVAIDIADEIRPGDAILIHVVRRVPAAPPPAAPPPGPVPAAPRPPPPETLEHLWVKIEAAPPAKVPFRKGGAAAAQAAPAGGPRAGGGGAPPADAPAGPPANIVHGSITVGYVGSFDSTKDAGDHSYQAPRASASLTVDRIGGENLTLRFRGDARAILDDGTDRTGGKLDRRIFLSELSLTYVGERNPLRISVGRVFAADAAQAGSVDGGRAGVALGPFEVGGFGGLDAAPDLDDRGRLKYGAYVTYRTPAPATGLAYDGGLAFVRTQDGGALDRQLVALDHRLAITPYVLVFNLVEVDLYSGTENPRDRPAVDLTDVFASVRVRPVRALDIGISYDRRRPYFGKQEIEDLFPATLDQIDDDLWQTLRADARVALPEQCFVRVFGDRRLGAGGGTAFGGEVGCDAIGGGIFRAALGGSHTDTSTIEGWGAHVRVGAWIAERVDATLSYRVFFDDYGDGKGSVVRQAPGLSVEVMLSRSFSLVADAEYEFGDEATRLLASVALTYRF